VSLTPRPIRAGARSTVELEVPDHVRCEAEVEVDEVEFESKWSTARTAVAGASERCRRVLTRTS
jgi:hypothetical protein